MANKSTQQTTILMFQELSKHCTKGEEDNAIYESGWNDERILASLQASNPEHTITLNMIRGIRRKMFGRLTVDRQLGLIERIEALENRLHDLEDYVSTSTGGRYKPPAGRPRSTPPSKE